MLDLVWTLKDGNYNLDDMRTEQDGTGFSKYIQLYGFHGMQYMNSKQAQLLYGRKLAQILSSEGANVSVTVLHPGKQIINTERDFQN